VSEEPTAETTASEESNETSRLDDVLDTVARFADRSYDKVEQELRNAHVMGKMTVSFGSAEVKRRLGDIFTSAPSSTSKASDAPPQSTPAAAERTAPQSLHGAVDNLIPGYDDLSASQVVKLLGDLTPEDLTVIEHHERHGRSRRTILNKIAQLTSAPDAAS